MNPTISAACLAACLVLPASGNDLDQMLVETIIAPLGMTRTIPSWDHKLRDRVLAERATYYRKGLFGFVPSEYRTRLSASAGSHEHTGSKPASYRIALAVSASSKSNRGASR